MRDDDLVLLAAGVLVVMATADNSIPNDGGWVWPVPDLITSDLAPQYYAAEQSQEFRRPTHMGVDLMYRRVPGVTSIATQSADHSDAKWFAPASTPIVAARDGVVWSVDRSPRGIEIVLDHGKPFATYYQHLASTSLPMGYKASASTKQNPLRVKAGDVIGVMGFDPTDPQGLRHLHFAVWKDGAGDAASIDPERAMGNWRRVTWRL